MVPERGYRGAFPKPVEKGRFRLVTHGAAGRSLGSLVREERYVSAVHDLKLSFPPDLVRDQLLSFVITLKDLLHYV